MSGQADLGQVTAKSQNIDSTEFLKLSEMILKEFMMILCYLVVTEKTKTYSIGRYLQNIRNSLLLWPGMNYKIPLLWKGFDG